MFIVAEYAALMKISIAVTDVYLTLLVPAENVMLCVIIIDYLSYNVASGSEITPCNKICKPLVVYRNSGNVMTSITTLRT